ncbi:MAG: hypothetical protein V1716_04960 [Candidatus Uhrbacteria bacterium]
MADGGLSTEEIGRKNRLDETNARNKRGRLSDSLISSLEGTQKKFESKTRTNLALSNFMAQELEERGIKPRGYLSSQLLGMGSSMIQKNLVGDQQSGSTDSEQKADQPSDSPEQPPNPIKADQQADQQNESVRQAQLLAGQQKSRLKEKILEESGANKAMDEVRSKTQKQAKKFLTKIARRGVEELAQSIGNAFDAGTVGVSTLVTIFMYAVTLTDLNAQMVWGHYIKHGKSFIFPALDWEPIPMPKIVGPRILHALLVIVDILVIGAIVIIFSLALLQFLLPFILVGGGIFAALNFLGISVF